MPAIRPLPDLERVYGLSNRPHTIRVYGLTDFYWQTVYTKLKELSKEHPHSNIAKDGTFVCACGCGRPIQRFDAVVSKGIKSAGRSHYYLVECAERLHIVVRRR